MDRRSPASGFPASLLLPSGGAQVETKGSRRSRGTALHRVGDHYFVVRLGAGAPSGAPPFSFPQLPIRRSREGLRWELPRNPARPHQLHGKIASLPPTIFALQQSVGSESEQSAKQTRIEGRVERRMR